MRRQVQPGFSLISNPFNAPVNLLDALISSPPLGAQFFKFGAGAFSSYVSDDLEMAWLPRGEVTLNPGEGGFLWTEAEGFELCFSGRVPQGLLQNPLPIRFRSAVRWFRSGERPRRWVYQLSEQMIRAIQSVVRACLCAWKLTDTLTSTPTGRPAPGSSA